MSTLGHWSRAVAIAVLPATIGAIVGFAVAFIAVLMGLGAFSDDAAEWSGANQGAVGMAGFMAGGIAGFFGFTFGALYSVRRLSRAAWRAEVF
jgi:uncharacterized membrane protein YfcA